MELDALESNTMSDESQDKIQINLDLAGLNDLLNSGVLRAYSAVCFSINTVKLPHLDLYPYRQHEPGIPPIQLLPDTMSIEQLTEYKEVFSQWVFGNALRELIEIFAIYLDELYKVAFFVNERMRRIESGGSLTELEEAVNKEIKVFEGKGVSEKLQIISSFGISTGLAEGIETLNIARNCLTHRNGIVGQGIRGDRDLNNGNSLIIRWKYFEIVYRYLDETEAKWIEGESPSLPEGTQVLQKIIDRVRETPKGERLILLPNDIGEIGYNFLHAGGELMKLLEQFLQDRGVTLTARVANTATET
jgi:hypothetical protein